MGSHFLYSVLWDLCILPFDSAYVCVCVYGDVYEADGFGFMMIILSEGVQNQSNSNACLPSPQAISKVGIDYSTHSCLSGGQTKETA